MQASVHRLVIDVYKSTMYALIFVSIFAFSHSCMIRSYTSVCMRSRFCLTHSLQYEQFRGGIFTLRSNSTDRNFGGTWCVSIRTRKLQGGQRNSERSQQEFKNRIQHQSIVRSSQLHRISSELYDAIEFQPARPVINHHQHHGGFSSII